MLTQSLTGIHGLCMRPVGRLMLALVVGVLASCGGGQQPDATGGWLAELPSGLKGASTTAQVDGSAHVMAGVGVTDTPPAAVLDGAGVDYSYAMYAFDPPAGEQVTAIGYALSAIDGECWLGLANYRADKWEWRQVPAAAGSGTVTFGDPADYLGFDGNSYWVVVAARDESVQVDGFTVTHLSTVTPMFYNPPAGQQTADSAGLAPQVVLLPPLTSNAQTAAPVIVYIKTVAGQPLLTLAYYDGSAWQQIPLYNSRSFSLPQARWLDGAGVIVAYDATNGQLLDIRVDEWWEIIDEVPVPLPSGEGIVPVMLSLDVDPQTGYCGVAYALAGDPARVYSNFEDAEGWGDPVLVGEYTGESIPGLSFKFDAAGGDPWLAFTHGIANYETEMTVDYALEYGRFDGTAWTLTDSGRSDSPMFVELGFDGTTPQIVFSEIKYKTLTFGIPPIFVYEVDVPLLADVYAGTHNGASWDYTRMFESTLTYSANLGDSTLTLHLNLAPACGWARNKELFYNQVTGDVVFDVDLSSSPIGITPRDGTLNNAVPYLADTGSGYQANAYFTGTAGMNFSWDELLPLHATAYVSAESISVDDIMSGRLGAESTLLYWTPED